MSEIQEQLPPAQEPERETMTFDLAQKLIREKHHGLQIGKDDPILVMLTLCNAFLDMEEIQYKRHEKALQQVLAGTLKEETSALHQSLHTLASEKIIEQLSVHQSAMNAFLERLRSASLTLSGWFVLILALGGYLVWTR